MPFSFKPDITPEAASTEQSMPQTGFGSSTQNLAERPKGEGRSIIEVFLFGVFGLMVIVVIVLFSYKYYLSSQVDAKKATLDTYESQLAGIPLDDMRKLSNRLKVINQLVKDHPSANVAFLIVEATVENPITFTRLDLRYSDIDKSYKLVLAGTSPDYRSIAQQMDTYKRKPYSTYIPNISVDGLTPDNSGKIMFTLTMPVSITGVIPETFSLIGGAAGNGISTLSGTSTVSVASTTLSTTLATTTPVITAPATTTSAMKTVTASSTKKP